MFLKNLHREFFILTLLLTLLSGSVTLCGQESLKRSEYDLTPLKGIVYFKEYAAGMGLHTNGINLGFTRGTITKYNITRFYQFQIGYTSDPRERMKSEYLPGFDGISSYTYGKQNSFYHIRGGMGKKVFLSEKAHERGIAVGYSFTGGLNFGILKPYHLILEYSNELDRTFRSEAYSEENAHLFLDPNKIRDKGGFLEGWDELSFVPGIHASVAAHFSLGAYEEYIKALEAGLLLDVYIRRVPIMVATEAHPSRFVFPSLYIQIHLGKRTR